MINIDLKFVNRMTVLLLMLADGLIHGLWVSGKIDTLHSGALLSITAAIVYMIASSFAKVMKNVRIELVMKPLSFIAMCIGLFFSRSALDFISFVACMMIVINQPCILSDKRNENNDDSE